MRISFKRRDGAYLFQNIKTGRFIWSTLRLDDHVLLSLKEPEYHADKITLSKRLIREMLDHGKLPESADDILIVETETIEFQNRDQ